MQHSSSNKSSNLRIDRPLLITISPFFLGLEWKSFRINRSSSAGFESEAETPQSEFDWIATVVFHSAAFCYPPLDEPKLLIHISSSPSKRERTCSSRYQPTIFGKKQFRQVLMVCQSDVFSPRSFILSVDFPTLCVACLTVVVSTVWASFSRLATTMNYEP